MIHSISLAFALAVLWLLLSGHLEPLLLALGAVSVALVVYLGRRMTVIDHESHPVHLTRGLLAYWPWLALQIVRSGFDVLRRILSPAQRISPTVLRIPIRQRTDLGRVIHANSITLTPGTVSMEVYDDSIAVHALARDIAEDLLRGEIDRRIPDTDEQC
jgi:multicomponent Na+:H+ antiporter subunit E